MFLNVYKYKQLMPLRHLTIVTLNNLLYEKHNLHTSGGLDFGLCLIMVFLSWIALV